MAQWGGNELQSFTWSAAPGSSAGRCCVGHRCGEEGVRAQPLQRSPEWRGGGLNGAYCCCRVWWSEPLLVCRAVDVLF